MSTAARLSLASRLLFGVGAAAEGTKNTAFNLFLLFYYNQVLGVSGTTAGAAIFLALCVDALVDPLIGSVSDGWRSRWGRRHPFMYAAPIPMAVCFALVFQPPDGLSEMALGAWLFVFAVGVRVSMTLYLLPSNALVPELAPGYDDRTSLIAWRYLFGWLGALAVAQLGYLHFFASGGDGSTDGRLLASGYHGFGIACAAIVASSILASTLGTHALIPRLRQPAEARRFTARRFAAEVREILATRSFRVLLGAALFASVAIGFNEATGLYVNTYFWELRTDQIAVLVYGLVASVLLGVVVVRPITERFDKKRSALGLAVLALVSGPFLIFLRLAGWMPPNGHVWLLPILFVRDVLLVTCMVAIGVITSSMLTDVADESELHTGKRQEGLFMATIALTGKATTGLGSLLAGVVLDQIGFPRAAEPGSVPADRVIALGLVVGPGVLALYLVTLAFLSRYPITRERHREIVDRIEQRRRTRGA